MCAAQPPRHRVRGAVSGSKVGTKQKRRLRDDLRLEAARRNDGDLLESCVRRRSGARVDEVMQASAPPAPRATSPKVGRRFSSPRPPPPPPPRAPPPSRGGRVSLSTLPSQPAAERAG